jgi:hypothetical protein
MVAIWVGVFVSVNVGEGVWVATSAISIAGQEIWLTINTNPTKEMKTKFLFISIEQSAN